MAVENKIDNGIKFVRASASALLITGVLALPELAHKVSAASAPIASPTPISTGCNFELGFRTLHDALPHQVGDCLDDETHNPNNGDALQHTTNGLLAWRKADNWTAFTNGYETWVNGPCGIEKRLNSQRYPWEAPGFDINGQRFQVVPETNPLCKFTVAAPARGGGGGGGDTQTSEITPTPTPEAKPTPPPGGRVIEPELDPNNPTNTAANTELANRSDLWRKDQTTDTTHYIGKVVSTNIDSAGNLVIALNDNPGNPSLVDQFTINLHAGNVDFKTWANDYWRGNNPEQVQQAWKYYVGGRVEISVNNQPYNGVSAYIIFG